MPTDTMGTSKRFPWWLKNDSIFEVWPEPSTAHMCTTKSKAKIELNWMPSYSTEESVNLTASWYIKYLQGKQASNLMLNDLSGCRGFKDAM